MAFVIPVKRRLTASQPERKIIESFNNDQRCITFLFFKEKYMIRNERENYLLNGGALCLSVVERLFDGALCGAQ